MMASIPPLQVLHTSVSRNFWKGGDFMEERREMSLPAVIQDQGRVSPATGKVEVGSNPDTHPLRRSRIKQLTPEEIATVLDADGKPTIDPVVYMSVSNMDGGF